MGSCSTDIGGVWAGFVPVHVAETQRRPLLRDKNSLPHEHNACCDTPNTLNHQYSTVTTHWCRCDGWFYSFSRFRIFNGVAEELSANAVCLHRACARTGQSVCDRRHALTRPQTKRQENRKIQCCALEIKPTQISTQMCCIIHLLAVARCRGALRFISDRLAKVGMMTSLSISRSRPVVAGEITTRLSASPLMRSTRISGIGKNSSLAAPVG